MSGKSKGGRPRKIESFDLKQMENIAEKGFTDKEIAKGLGVTAQTLNNYKKDYPEFFDSLKRGKSIADGKVEVALFMRAVGYSHPDVHITVHQGKVVKTPIIKHFAPDPTSMIFWLKNRQPERWRDKQEVQSTNINIEKTANMDDEEKKAIKERLERKLNDNGKANK